MAEPKYGSFEMEAVRFTDHEAWWFWNGRRKTMPAIEVLMSASVLTKTAYDELFGELPPLPPEAFRGH